MNYENPMTEKPNQKIKGRTKSFSDVISYKCGCMLKIVLGTIDRMNYCSRHARIVFSQMTEQEYNIFKEQHMVEGIIPVEESDD